MAGRGYGYTQHDTVGKVELTDLREAPTLVARLALRIASEETWPVPRKRMGVTKEWPPQCVMGLGVALWARLWEMLWGCPWSFARASLLIAWYAKCSLGDCLLALSPMIQRWL